MPNDAQRLLRHQAVAGRGQVDAVGVQVREVRIGRHQRLDTAEGDAALRQRAQRTGWGKPLLQVESHRFVAYLSEQPIGIDKR